VVRKDPRVFDPGAVTVTLSPDGFRVYAGTLEIKYVRSATVAMDGDSGASTLEVRFYQSHDPVTSMNIEESIRSARTVPWIRVIP
jgi:hypothetical protein